MNNIEEKNQPLYIDLFAGCGGLSLGLHKAGWKGLFAIEKSPDAFSTLRHNLIDKVQHFEWVPWLRKRNHDIKSVIKGHRANLIDLRGKVDMVTGGPPCQGFSTAGKRDEGDRRNKLINDYIDFIALVRPKILFFENVKGFTLGFKKNEKLGKEYSTYVVERLEELGYDVCGDMINFSDFGIPQKRCRFILVGIRRDLLKNNDTAKVFFKNLQENKEVFLVSKNLELRTTLEEAISDLLRKHGEDRSPDTKSFMAGKYSETLSRYQFCMRGDIQKGEIADSHRFVKHKKSIEDRFNDILNNCTRNKSIDDVLRLKYNLKKRTIVPLAQNQETPTLTTLPDDYIHYSEPRILTVREYARIQSFPDSFEIKGKYTTGGDRRTKEAPRYTQIGNAIPPLFGEQSGLVLKQFV